MVDSSGPLSAAAALDQLIAEQRAQATAAPQGVFSQLDPAVIGLAQGLLTPTKTGSFGESIGQGLAGMQGPLEAMRKQQMASKDKLTELMLAKAKLDMEMPYYQARADYFSNKSDPSTMSDSEILRNMARANALIDSGNLSQEDEFATKLLLKNYNDEITKRRGITPKPAGEPKKEQPADDGVDWWNPLTWGGGSSSKTEPEQKSKSGGESGAGETAPKQGKKSPASQAEELYKGDSPPKEFPNAIKHPDGTWYVVKEGKTYPVLK